MSDKQMTLNDFSCNSCTELASEKKLLNGRLGSNLFCQGEHLWWLVGFWEKKTDKEKTQEHLHKSWNICWSVEKQQKNNK